MTAEAVRVLVMTGAGGAEGLTVSARVAVPVPPEFVALKATLNDPEVVGVPEIRPEFVLRSSRRADPWR